MSARQPVIQQAGWWLALALGAGCGLARAQDAPAAADAEAPVERVEFERWYSVLLGEQPAGWMHARSLRQADRLISTTRARVSLRRGPTVLAIEMSSRFEETADGKPIAATSLQKLGGMEMRQSLRFEEDGIHMVLEQAGRRQERTLARPKGEASSWQPPAAAGRRLEEAIARGQTRIESWTIDPALGGEPVKLTMELRGPVDVQVLGRVAPALEWDATSSRLPGVVTRDYTDLSGRSLKSSTPLLPGLAMEMVASDRELAMKQISPAALPELLAGTLVQPEGRIDHPRQVRQAVYELSLTPAQEGEAADDAALARLLPRSGAQRVVWDHQRLARVVVDLDQPAAPGADLPQPAHRRSSLMIDADDPAVRALLGRALAELPADAEALARALALRRFVHRHITRKDLSVGLASASEVARTAQGDCTEHAVLLAALLRATGLPSRTASGLIYVEVFQGRQHVFGYHMWTQAFMEIDGQGGRWVDLDASLEDQPFDAAHILLVHSAMDDAPPQMDGYGPGPGEDPIRHAVDDAFAGGAASGGGGGVVNDMVVLLPVLGRLSIRVVETSP